MELTLDPLEWDSEDRQALRNFLNTRAGSRLLPKVAEELPQLMENGETNAILVRTGVVKGAQEAIKAILLLARPEPETPKETPAYPSLTDDANWNDGSKIEIQ